MNESISKIVHPVINYGLNLKDRLCAGEALDLEYEQARLKDLLLSDEEAQFHEDFGRDDDSGNGQDGDSFNVDRRRLSNSFLGVRYVLVCWLDELFTLDSQWSHEWTEHKLEGQLYGSNDRAWKFWEQARQAQARPGTSALEAFYLCVNLGFRGNLREQHEKLASWINQSKMRLGKVEELDFPFSTERTITSSVPPLSGASKFRTMAMTCWLALLIVIPLISFALMHKLGD